MMDDDPRPRASRATRHALTVALVKPGRGVRWNHNVKFVQRHVVDAFRNRRRDAVEYQHLQFLPLRDLWNRNQISHLRVLLMSTIVTPRHYPVHANEFNNVLGWNE